MINTALLNFYMARKGVRNPDIANLLGCSETSVISKKNNRSEFTAGQFRMVCDYLGLTADEVNEVLTVG